MIKLGKIDEFDNINELVQLLGNLFDDPVISRCNYSHDRNLRVYRRTRRNALNVISPAAEEGSNPGQDPEFVFSENGNSMPHLPPLLDSLKLSFRLFFFFFEEHDIQRCASRYHGIDLFLPVYDEINEDSLFHLEGFLKYRFHLTRFRRPETYRSISLRKGHEIGHHVEVAV